MTLKGSLSVFVPCRADHQEPWKVSEDGPEPAGRGEKRWTSNTTQTAVVLHGHQGTHQATNNHPGPCPGSRQELAVSASICLYHPGTPQKPSEL